MVADHANSARIAPLQHMSRAVAIAAGNSPGPPALNPNEIELYSYYKPGLEAGRYTIQAEQRISSQYNYKDDHHTEFYHVYNRKTQPKEEDRRQPNFPQTQPIIEQQFEVVAPQFSLDPKLINSYYPPSGHQDEGRILPHICLQDPHFPWEREPDRGVDELQDIDRDAAGKALDATGKIVPEKDAEEDAAKRNCVPWIALMVFDHEDLPPLTDPEKTALNLPSTLDLTKQPSNGAFQMTVKEYLDITSSNRVDFDTGEDPLLLKKLKDETDPSSKERTTVIFPTKHTWQKLFPNVQQLKYASHVRNINTTGFPGAGVDQLGLYSIVVSNRTGNYNIDKPTVQICHLVSVEFFETTRKTIMNKDPEGRIALISLFNWTYMALPPNPVNFVDSIRHVLKEMQVLRPQDSIVANLKSQRDAETNVGKKKALDNLATRPVAGYTLARWRTETGEETMAFNRGPLVPQKLPDLQPKPTGTVGNAPVSDWPIFSTSGKEYQIFDSQTGLMDLSYSAAWSLGKTLAISDTTFNGALSRFRSWVQKLSQSQARKLANRQPSSTTLAVDVAGVVEVAGSLTSGVTPEPTRVMVPDPSKSAVTSLDNPAVLAEFVPSVAQNVSNAGSTIGGEIYNEFNKEGHTNTDWTIIHQWISEKLYLSDIPAHVIIPDPSFLPEECLRFFHIDDVWMDCLIDGALSVANHLDTKDDWLRAAIKSTYNQYLKLPVQGANYQPQIPGYGFILRSQIVKVMPDLKISVEWQKDPSQTETDPKKLPAEFCRWTRPDDHTLLCLLDRPPEELSQVILSQPPHQQRFAFGHAYEPVKHEFEFQLRQMYTRNRADPPKPPPENVPASQWASLPDEVQPHHPPPVVHQGDPVKPSPASTWLSDDRVINFALMSSWVNDEVKNYANKDPHSIGFYEDFIPNSAELALELNDPSYFFVIRPFKDPLDPNRHEPTPVKTFTKRNRQLWGLAKISLPDPSDDSPKTPKDSHTIGSDSIGIISSGDAPPPHIPSDGPPNKAVNVPFKDIETVPANPSRPLGTSQPLRKFSLSVFADYKGFPTMHKSGRVDRKNFVPTQNDYLYDLIFSVRRLEKADYKLREIVINVPHTGISSKFEPLLDGGASGPKARMLSNQRFVPFLNWTKEVLQIRLVPRSAQEHPVIQINNDRTKEISFRLEEVAVVPTRTPEAKRTSVNIEPSGSENLGVVVVTAYERYEIASGEVVSASPPSQWFLVKRDIKDPDEKYQ